MTTTVLQPGQPFPSISVSSVGGGEIDLGKPENGHDWKMIIVYRGKHCPICTQYLQAFNQLLPEFNALGVDVVAVSADSAERAAIQLAQVNPNFPVGCDLSIEQMRQLGLFISDAKLGMDAERPFAEPGLFVINQKGNVQMIDISNVPVARPDPNSMLGGLKFMKGIADQYPVSGSYT